MLGVVYTSNIQDSKEAGDIDKSTIRSLVRICLKRVLDALTKVL
jgi:hypothetical protein